MHHIPPAFTLLPRQCRQINATEGFRLEVRSGCLWLTRPGDAVDRFLVAGSTLDLHETRVLIQSDRQPGAAGGAAARYVLVPIRVSSAKWYSLWLMRLVWRVRVYLQGLTQVCARDTLPPARGAQGLR